MTTPSSVGRPSDEALAEYLAGTLTGGAAASVEAWLASEPSRRADLDALRHVLRGAPLETVRASLGAEIRAGRFTTQGRDRQPIQPWRDWRRVWLGAAAAAGVALVVGVLTHSGMRALWQRTPRTLGVAPITVAPANGQRATVSLPDGSTVTLAPGSTMRYARQFSAATQRTIELDGQALFTVATHDGAPFIVTSRGLEARVLGTTFGVRHYAGDRAGLVIVYSGKVSASGGRTAVPLTAGMQATVMDSTVVASTVADTGEMVDWTHGQLVFRRVPVATVLGALERWYGNQFQLEDTTLARRPVTATFAMDDRAEMLRIVRHVLEVDMTFDGSTVMLQPTRDARHHGTGDQRRKDNYPTSTREVGR